jgi:hypothetical protein
MQKSTRRAGEMPPDLFDFDMETLANIYLTSGPRVQHHTLPMGSPPPGRLALEKNTRHQMQPVAAARWITG